MPLCYGNEWVMVSSNRIPLLTQFWPYVSRCFLLSFFRIIFLVRHSCPVHTQSTSKREHSLSFDVCPRMPPNLGNKQGSKYTRVGMNFDFRHLRFRTLVSDFFIRNISVRFFYFGHQWTLLDSFHPYPRRLECLTICRCRSEGSTLPSYFKTLSVRAVKVLKPRPPARQSGALQHELTRQRLCGICGTRQVFCFAYGKKRVFCSAAF